MSSLSDWTKAQFTALYATGVSSGDSDLDERLKTNFDATFSPNVEIHLNHNVVDREKFKEFVDSRRSKTAEIQCNAEDLVETPVEDCNAEAGSIVAGKMTLVRTHPFRIRAAPAKTSTVIMFSAKIKRDPEPQIVQLFQTTADKSFQINLGAPRTAAAEESGV